MLIFGILLSIFPVVLVQSTWLLFISMSLCHGLGPTYVKGDRSVGVSQLVSRCPHKASCAHRQVFGRWLDLECECRLKASNNYMGLSTSWGRGEWKPHPGSWWHQPIGLQAGWDEREREVCLLLLASSHPPCHGLHIYAHLPQCLALEPAMGLNSANSEVK